MKIVVVAPLWLPIPPPAYGGVEKHVADLVDGLTVKGHHVTLYAPGTTVSKAQQLVAITERPLRDSGVDWSDLNYGLWAASRSIDQAESEGSDAVIFSVERPYALPLVALAHVPTLFTLHGIWTYETQPKSEVDLLMAFKGENFISISYAQRAQMPELHYVANVYHAIDPSKYSFNASPDDYAVWLGRLEEEKGAHIAIEVAKKAGIRLILAGPKRLDSPKGRAYFEGVIEPQLGSTVDFLGELTEQEKVEVLRNAAVLLNPYKYQEAFGYVTLEALACGTPAVVPTWGAGSEIIEEGVSGFARSSIDAWAKAVVEAQRLDREACRLRAMRFTIDEMVSGYEDAVRRVTSSA